MRDVALTAIRDVALVALVALSAWGLGERVRDRLRLELAGLERVLAAVALGLVAHSTLLFALGVTGVLGRGAVAAALALGVAAAWRPLARAAAGRAASGRSWPRPTFESVVLAAAVVVAFAAAAPGALVPEWFYDALYYHAAFPSLYLLRGRIEVFPHAAHSAMPSSIDLLYLPLVGFGGASSVKLGHLAFLLGTCLWLVALARRLFGGRAGLAAMALLAGLPGVGIASGLGAIDLGVTFFTTGAFALLLGDRAGEGGGSGERRTRLAAAALLGMAAGAKYSALSVVAVALVLLAARAWRGARSPRGVAAELCAAGAVLALVAGPWYLRNLIALGAPLYPALSGPGTPGEFAYLNLRQDAIPPYPWRELWRLPGDLIGERRPFGAGAEVFPAILFLASALIWGASRRGAPRVLAVLVVALTVAWARSILILRYLYPALALAALLAGGMLFRAGRSRPATSLGAVAVLAACLAGAGREIGVQRRLFGGAAGYLGGAVTADAFLERALPHYPAARWVRERTDPRRTRLLLLGETRSFYFERDVEPVSGYDRHPLVTWAAEASDAEDLRRMLRAKGFTHLVWNASEFARLNHAYRHCVLGPREARIVERLIQTSPVAFADPAVTVVALGPVAPDPRP